MSSNTILPKNDPDGNIQRSSGKLVTPNMTLDKIIIPVENVEPFVVIGNYKFTPVLSYLNTQGHTELYFTSIDNLYNEIRYTAYRSNSAIGFWHLKLKVYSGQYVKGPDYVQSALLHPGLQVYFSAWNTNKKSLRELPTGYNKWNSDEMKDETYDEIVDKNRCLNNLSILPENIQVFKNYNDLEQSKCGNKENKYKLLLMLSKTLSDMFASKVSKPALMYKNYIYDYSSNGERIYILGDIYLIQFDTIVLYYLQYKMDIFKTIDFTKGNEPKNEWGNPLQSKIVNEIHRFGDDVIPKFIPILLTTSTNSITKSGLNTEYISAGDYICKAFDYGSNEHTRQTPFQNKGHGSKKNKNYNPKNFLPHEDFPKPIGILGTYYYIGFKYDEIFPYTIIKESLKSIKLLPSPSQQLYTPRPPLRPRTVPSSSPLALPSQKLYTPHPPLRPRTVRQLPSSSPFPPPSQQLYTPPPLPRILRQLHSSPPPFLLSHGGGIRRRNKSSKTKKRYTKKYKIKTKSGRR